MWHEFVFLGQVKDIRLLSVLLCRRTTWPLWPIRGGQPDMWLLKHAASERELRVAISRRTSVCAAVALQRPEDAVSDAAAAVAPVGVMLRIGVEHAGFIGCRRPAGLYHYLAHFVTSTQSVHYAPWATTVEHVLAAIRTSIQPDNVISIPGLHDIMPLGDVRAVRPAEKPVISEPQLPEL